MNHASATIPSMILLLAFTCAVGVVSILLARYLRLKKIISSEVARKSVHITHAFIIASWPFFTNYKVVIAGEVMSFVLVAVARAFKLFGPFREVERLSWGEFFFPLAVICMAIIEPDKWVFVAAVMHFGLADAFAAIIGDRIKRGHYIVFDHNHKKSLVGTAVFWIISCGITTWFISNHAVPGTALWPMIVVVPTLTALTENISPWGSDNFTVPLLAFWLLTSL